MPEQPRHSPRDIIEFCDLSSDALRDVEAFGFGNEEAPSLEGLNVILVTSAKLLCAAANTLHLNDASDDLRGYVIAAQERGPRKQIDFHHARSLWNAIREVRCAAEVEMIAAPYSPEEPGPQSCAVPLANAARDLFESIDYLILLDTGDIAEDVRVGALSFLARSLILDDALRSHVHFLAMNTEAPAMSRVISFVSDLQEELYKIIGRQAARMELLVRARSPEVVKCVRQFRERWEQLVEIDSDAVERDLDVLARKPGANVMRSPQQDHLTSPAPVLSPVISGDQTYSPADLAAEICVSGDTINDYAKESGVQTPGRGERNHRYTAAERTTIFEYMSGHASPNIAAACKSAMGNRN